MAFNVSRFIASVKCACYGPESICNCPVREENAALYIENVQDVADTVAQIMRICGVPLCKAQSALDVIQHGLVEYEERITRIDTIPEKCLRSCDVIRNLGLKCSMNRREVFLTHAILKRAFRAFYYGTNLGGVPDATNEEQLEHSAECIWSHAAKRIAEIFASVEGLFFSAQKHYESRFRCLFKDLNNRVRARNSSMLPGEACVCGGCSRRRDVVEGRQQTVDDALFKQPRIDNEPDDENRKRSTDLRFTITSIAESGHSMSIDDPYSVGKERENRYGSVGEGPRGTLTHLRPTEQTISYLFGDLDKFKSGAPEPEVVPEKAPVTRIVPTVTRPPAKRRTYVESGDAKTKCPMADTSTSETTELSCPPADSSDELIEGEPYTEDYLEFEGEEYESDIDDYLEEEGMLESSLEESEEPKRKGCRCEPLTCDIYECKETLTAECSQGPFKCTWYEVVDGVDDKLAGKSGSARAEASSSTSGDKVCECECVFEEEEEELFKDDWDMSEIEIDDDNDTIDGYVRPTLVGSRLDANQMRNEVRRITPKKTRLDIQQLYMKQQQQMHVTAMITPAPEMTEASSSNLHSMSSLGVEKGLPDHVPSEHGSESLLKINKFLS